MSTRKIHRYHVVVTVMLATGIGYAERVVRASSRINAIARARRDLSVSHHILGIRAELVRERRKAKA
jgi:hypothetical protein